MKPLIRALISAQALQANLASIRAQAPRSKVMAVVKANAYGHGLVPTAKTLHAADSFAVARLGEAMALREAGIAHSIVLLEGVFDGAQLATAARASLEIVVHHEEQLRLLEMQPERGLTVWLKIDTGMNRLGFREDEARPVLQRLRALQPALREIRLLTHLACADDIHNETTTAQLQRFAPLVRETGLVSSIANSAGLLAWPAAQADWVRPGLALYGVSPVQGRSTASFGLAPAMNLETTVISTRNVLPGESVGYGGSWTAARRSRIAILAAGYGDGLPWSLPSGSPVLIAGRRVPLVGRVSMDMVAVDVTDVPDVSLGTGARLWGEGLPVEEVAAAARTLPYELLCAVSQRVPLEFCCKPADSAAQLPPCICVCR